ncbi:hypothetical protein IWQ47_001435 [Aquimarina sp. EL_43]|uniref:DUF6252 family protein n=1 Tax=Aquimarina TaxID=290174 RepID=UPI00046F9B9C|nr:MULTISPECIES: DUF6252 family protein [Aquimarina]MBG6130482.1 hypothetical protein [Aquimarina sp. EL_35]MBG6149262.1 hypothetical protein [Aquimarina sp. EL_32]MBG6168364.1 hypothetical protein [Aquimarina sp. EL_43]
MIKKITPLMAVICLFLTSCSTDIEINTPALQAKIDGELFRSSIKKAVIYEDGTLVISGSSGDKSISFTTTSTNVGTYKTALQTISKVSFQKNQTKFISKDGETEGEVSITEIYNNEISGNFHFKDLKDDNGNPVDFNNGWFYRLPLENGTIEEEVPEEINPCLLNASLTALVNNTEMITDNHTAKLFGVDDASILITATNETEEVNIVFMANVAPGTYPLTGSGNYSASYEVNNDKSSALSGTLIITSHDIETKCISGSFEFETRSGSQISQGSFDFGY